MINHKNFYLGWQVGITYEAPELQGVSLDKMLRLLDEMAHHGMNFLSLMMTSYAYFSPNHDGFCWPVKNSRLECFRDQSCTNADSRTELISTVIVEAEKRGIAVQLFTNLAIYNPDRIRKSYPGAAEQRSTTQSYPWLFCPNSPDVWQLEMDEIEDLLTFYPHSNVKSIGYERLSFAPGSCYCDSCREQFRKDTGRDLSNFQDGDPVFDGWKIDTITEKMRLLNDRIKTLHPDIEVWLHSSCAPGWGHNPSRLKDAGIDCVLPHVAHFPMAQQDINELLDQTSPNDTVLHFCVRNKALNNYNIWPKSPETIARIGDWIEEYQRKSEHLKGILFFNENTVPVENRAAVYRLIKRFKA